LTDHVKVAVGCGKGMWWVAGDKLGGEVGKGEPALAKGCEQGGDGRGAEGAMGVRHEGRIPEVVDGGGDGGDLEGSGGEGRLWKGGRDVDRPQVLVEKLGAFQEG
jgi:hypothetical protein